MPFFPNSALYEKNYPPVNEYTRHRDITYMPVVIFSVCLDLKKNVYSRTIS